MQRAAQVDQAALGQLICLNGMLSDPNTPGTEKLTATHAQSSWLSSPVTRFVTGSKHKGIRGTGLAMPQEVFMVKGWNRSASLMMVLYAAYDSSEFYKVRCCSVFVCVFAKQLCFRRPSRLKWQRVSLSHKKYLTAVQIPTPIPLLRSFRTIHTISLSPQQSEIVSVNRGFPNTGNLLQQLFIDSLGQE